MAWLDVAVRMAGVALLDEVSDEDGDLVDARVH